MKYLTNPARTGQGVFVLTNSTSQQKQEAWNNRDHSFILFLFCAIFYIFLLSFSKLSLPESVDIYSINTFMFLIETNKCWIIIFNIWVLTPKQRLCLLTKSSPVMMTFRAWEMEYVLTGEISNLQILYVSVLMLFSLFVFMPLSWSKYCSRHLP